MEFIDPDSVKRVARAREHLLEFQRRIFKLEHLLEDLSRSVEIAQYSRQYNVTDVFTRQATELLADRLTLPETNQSDTKFTVIEGDLTATDINDIRSKHGMDAVDAGQPQVEISNRVRRTKKSTADSE
jgi:hypothetical protein